MKVNSLALAFAVASSSSFVPAPLVSAVTTYSCKVDADYIIEDDPTNPTYPTTAEKDWAVSKVRSSYRAVHNSGSGGDFDMTSADWDSFTLTAQSAVAGRRSGGTGTAHGGAPEIQFHIPGKFDTGSLRGNHAKQDNLKAWTPYDGSLSNSVSLACNLCGSWDDDDAAAMNNVEGDSNVSSGTLSESEKAWLNEYVGATVTHDRWVEAYCDELQQGPYSVFEFAYGCTITLYDCTSAAWNDEIERIKKNDSASQQGQQEVVDSTSAAAAL